MLTTLRAFCMRVTDPSSLLPADDDDDDDESPPPDLSPMRLGAVQ